MIFEYLRTNVAIKDEEFNAIYPKDIRELSPIHWTPVNIAKSAAKYLADRPGTKVLDIGSGAGKFCLVGSAFTRGVFTGVEQRKRLVDVSREISNNYKLNVSFVHSNVLEVPFSDFDSFYFFNSFHEHVQSFSPIDHSIELSVEYYLLYSEYVRMQLSKAPVGTRLVTYCSAQNEVPNSYKAVLTAHDKKLVFWRKGS